MYSPIAVATSKFAKSKPGSQSRFPVACPSPTESRVRLRDNGGSVHIQWQVFRLPMSCPALELRRCDSSSVRPEFVVLRVQRCSGLTAQVQETGIPRRGEAFPGRLSDSYRRKCLTSRCALAAPA